MKRLSKKEKDFAKEYAKTGNGVQSALKTYDTKNYSSAATIADANLKKPRVQEVIKSIADQIPDSLLVKVHNEGLRATRSFAVGEEVIETADHATRHKFLDSGYKIKGVYAPEKHEVSQHIIELSPEEKQLGKEYEDKLKSKL